MYKIIVLTIIAAFAATEVDSHGRLMRPTSRSSLWRVPEFEPQNPPRNNYDDALFCGGRFQNQFPPEECGVCGDPSYMTTPRENEINGEYYRGIVAARYKAGDVIDVEGELTVGHLGFMDWRLCTTPHSGETQACFNRHILQKADGSGTTIVVDRGTAVYTTKLRLPAGVTCQECVIQWNYRAGDVSGECQNGTIAVGCGPQQTYRGCSDVVIT